MLYLNTVTSCLSIVICMCVSQTSAMATYDVSTFCRSGRQTKTIAVPSLERQPWDSSGILRMERFSNNSTCSITLLPSKDESVLLTIRKVDLQADCKDNFRIFYSGYKSIVYCGQIADRSELQTFSSGSNITVAFQSVSALRPTIGGFELIYTAYVSDFFCDSHRLFRCDNFRCIAEVLRCDGHNHCGDRSDQRSCGPSAGSIVGIVIGGAFFAVAAIACIVCCIRRKRPRNTASINRQAPTIRSPIRPTTSTSYQSHPQIPASYLANTIPSSQDAPPAYQEAMSENSYYTTYPQPTHAYPQDVARYSPENSSHQAPPAYSTQPAYNEHFRNCQNN